MNQPAPATPAGLTDSDLFDALAALCLRQMESMRNLDDLVRRLPQRSDLQTVIMGVVGMMTEAHAVLTAKATLAAIGAKISPQRMAVQLLGVQPAAASGPAT